MRRKWMFWMYFLIPPLLVLFTWLFGEVVMHLWNWLTPSLFGWHQITFWQAIGLLLLCRILFGGFGGHGRDRSRWKRKNAERWERMTPEEREKFRRSWSDRCGGFGAPTSETNEPA